MLEADTNSISFPRRSTNSVLKQLGNVSHLTSAVNHSHVPDVGPLALGLVTAVTVQPTRDPKTKFNLFMAKTDSEAARAVGHTGRPGTADDRRSPGETTVTLVGKLPVPDDRCRPVAAATVTVTAFNRVKFESVKSSGCQCPWPWQWSRLLSESGRSGSCQGTQWHGGPGGRDSEAGTLTALTVAERLRPRPLRLDTVALPDSAPGASVLSPAGSGPRAEMLGLTRSEPVR